MEVVIPYHKVVVKEAYLVADMVAYHLDKVVMVPYHIIKEEAFHIASLVTSRTTEVEVSRITDLEVSHITELEASHTIDLEVNHTMDLVGSLTAKLVVNQVKQQVHLGPFMDINHMVKIKELKWVSADLDQVISNPIMALGYYQPY